MPDDRTPQPPDDEPERTHYFGDDCPGGHYDDPRTHHERAEPKEHVWPPNTETKDRR